jgi:hypothetical protein
MTKAARRPNVLSCGAARRIVAQTIEEHHRMTYRAKIMAAAVVAVGLAFAVAPLQAQQPRQPPAPPGLKQGSPGAIAAAKELLAMKNANGIYANAVPTIVSQAKEQLVQSYLNYQKDLNEVAVIVAQSLAGREREIGEGWALIYTNEFSEQELKDLVAFYKSPLGQKLLAADPRAMQLCMSYMNQWAQIFGQTVNEQFRAEMKKRGKDI